MEWSTRTYNSKSNVTPVSLWMFFSKILVGLESQVFSFSPHRGQFTSSCTGFSNCSLAIYFGISTVTCLPLLATVKDKNYPVESNYRSSERNLASAASQQLWTQHCRPALLFQQCVIKALVCSGESYCIVELLTEYTV